MKKLLTGLTLALSFAANANWEYLPQIDPMTDADKSVIVTNGKGADLGIRCNAGTVEIIFLYDYVGEGDKLQARIDGGEVLNYSTSSSTNGRSRFIVKQQRAEFIEAMKAGKTMVTRVEDFRGTQKIAHFNLFGLSDALGKLSCIKSN